MRMLRTPLIYLLLSVPLSAQDRAPDGEVGRPVHDISFSSKRIDDRKYPELHYRACNESPGYTAFRWFGAGFSVTASAELAPDYCAYKRSYSRAPAPSQPRPHDVDVQGKGSGQVITWSLDTVETLHGRVSNIIETYVSGPEGREPSTLEVSAESSEDGVGEIRVASSGALDSIVILFPEGPFELGGFLEPLELSASLTAVSLSEAVEPSQLTEDYDGDREVLLLERDGEEAYAAVFAVEAPGELGPIIVLLGAVDNEVAILNEMEMPQVPF